MLYDFKLPDIGEGVHEATVLEWKTAVGEQVEEGDVLAVVETDKVAAEIPSPRSGVVSKLGAEPGHSIRVGEILARIEISGGNENGTAQQNASVVGKVESSSAVLLEASLEGVSGQPPAGRTEGQAGSAAAPATGRKPQATPVARRLALREGIDLASLRGSGPAGRILKDDILFEIESRRNGDTPAEGGSTTPRRYGPQKLSTLRRTAVRNLEASWRIPAAVVHDFAVVDELAEVRVALNRDTGGSPHPKLSFLPFFIKAAAASLLQYPLLNAWYNEERQIVDPRGETNIGFAMDTEQGLVVPVVEGAHRLTLSEIQDLIDLRRSQAAQRELRVEDLRGGTFTLSNYGSIGGTYGRPMILPPQVAVLGLGRIHQAPVAREGRLVAAAILPLSFVFDHRVCDGSYAVRFLNRFMELVSKPVLILR